jgi:diaminopimelate decarboxylase
MNEVYMSYSDARKIAGSTGGKRVANSFLTDVQAREIAGAFGTPCYVYSQQELLDRARIALSVESAFGLGVRYAMKALPNVAILQTLYKAGVGIDASSGYEAERALAAGVSPSQIQLTSQEVPGNLKELIEQGISFNACSLFQLEQFGEIFPGKEVSIRVNPGLGAGFSNRTNVGGPSSSFGIWHEQIDEAISIAHHKDVTISGLHSHIGAGTDPEVWVKAADLTLTVAKKLPDVHTVNLGGGFKVARLPEEQATDLSHIVGVHIKKRIEQFAKEHSRELKLEIEPGTWFAASVGAILMTITDRVSTGKEGNLFLKTDSGMTEIIRTSLYGSQHPMEVVAREKGEMLIVGHCCESGDILTPADGDPEGLKARILAKAERGDYLVLGGAGAYCASMPAGNYNSFPLAAEVLIDTNGHYHEVRVRQTLEQITANERSLGK